MVLISNPSMHGVKLTNGELVWFHVNIYMGDIFHFEF